MNIKKIAITAFTFLLVSCATQTGSFKKTGDSNDLLIVDCLLPGQVRALGQIATYVTARRAIKTSAVECGIRGGEYVAYDRANYLTALNIWMPKAQAGDADAQNYVGEIYEKGMGIKPDFEMAFIWYKKAAQQGNSKAQMNLGYLYEKGLGTENNKVKAMNWYAKASDLPNSNISYATTISTDSNANQLSAELRLLKTALNNSQQESKTLKNKLGDVRNQLSVSQSELVVMKDDKISLNSKIQQQNQLSLGDKETDSLKKLLKEKNVAIEQQKNKIATLKDKYKQETESLTASLTSSQERAKQIVVELKKENKKTTQSQVALLEVEAKLAETERKMLEIDEISSQKSLEIQNIKQNKDDKHELDLELQHTQQQIEQLEQEKVNNQDLITQLKKENKVISNAEKELKNRLLTEKLSEKKIIELNSQLNQQQELLNQKQSELHLIQKQLDKSDQKHSDLAFLYQQQLKAVEQDKLNLQTQLLSNKSDKAKYLQDISVKNLQLEELRDQLSKEKQRYEREKNSLQKIVKNEQDVGKPSIEIIDPPFVLTRGVPTVTLRSVVKQREVVGRIQAPAGLLALSVNDQKRKVNDQGVFKTDIKLTDQETHVQIVAVDKKGAKASLNFVFSLGDAVLKSKKDISIGLAKENEENSWRELDFGHYYALIIGNNNYQKVPKLDTPETDATVIDEVLRSKYGFRTKLLLNATRYQILSELNKLRAKLTENDNLLIYYAGHGELDKVNMRGHWLPVDADGDNSANWISTIAITDILNAMSVKHVMVVSDSCYSGAMTRSSLARLEVGVSAKQRLDWLKAMLKTRSRTVLTSGGLKPVMDGGGGQHSVFAKAFINTLQKNQSLLEGQDLYRNVSAGIVSIASEYGIEQVPEYAPIRHAGHESGEFFFVPVKQ